MSDIMIVPGFKMSFSDPLLSYEELETAIKEHNSSALPGEKYWGILFEDECYSVYEYGEVPIEPEKPEPVVPDEPTLSEIKQNKIYEMSKECEDTIYNGIDVELTTGKKSVTRPISTEYLMPLPLALQNIHTMPTASLVRCLVRKILLLFMLHISSM